MPMRLDPSHLSDSARYALYPTAMLELARFAGSILGLRPTPQWSPRIDRADH